MKNIIHLLFMMLLTGCTFDDNGDPHLTTTFYVILFLFILLFTLAIILGQKKSKQVTETLERWGMHKTDLKFMGKYVGGHPDYNENINRVVVVDNGDILQFYDQLLEIEIPRPIFKISKSSILSIDIEDASSIERKITVGRIFLVGIFALGWRKKKKNELAFTVITWNDGRFEHNTVLSFEKENAMTQANTARNELIKACRNMTTT